jgi:hypothetical protein
MNTSTTYVPIRGLHASPNYRQVVSEVCRRWPSAVIECTEAAVIARIDGRTVEALAAW